MKFLNLKPTILDIEFVSLDKGNKLRRKNDPYFTIYSSFLNVINHANDYWTNKLISFGLMGNLCFFIFFIGKVIFQYLKKDENTYYIMNETMFIVDPKEKEKIKLWEADLKKDNQKGEGIVIIKEDYHQYGEM